MTTPQTIQSMFDTTGQARFRTAVAAHGMEVLLRGHGVSYQTKIINSKKTGREFVVTLLSGGDA